MLQKIIFIILLFILGSSSFAQHKTFHTAKAPAPKAGTMFFAPERIPMLDGSLLNAERGMIFVPINRARAQSDVIAVEVYRFKRTKKANPNTTPIFFLHGGPNFMGLEKSLAKVGTFEKLWKDMTDISDLVIIGQRGIGSSKPTTTINNTQKLFALEKPFIQKEAVAAYQKTLKTEKEIWEKLGLDLNGYTILEVAADVNDVREALGYDKIVIWGGSFGSHWGMALMRYHPQIVERAILRGMEGPNHTYDDPGAIWNVFKRVAKLAEKSPELKSLIPKGGLIKAIESFVQNAVKNPFTVSYTDPNTNKKYDVLIDGNVARNLAKGNSRNLQDWPAAVIKLHNSDFSDVTKNAIDKYKNIQTNYKTASYWMLDTGSGITPDRLAKFEVDPAQNIIGSTYWSYAAGSSVWDSDLGNEFRQNFETNIPTVIVHGTWDTSTPYENALELVPYFKNSKFIPLKRGPHGSIRAALNIDEQFKKGIYKFAATGNMTELPDSMEMPIIKFTVPVLKK